MTSSRVDLELAGSSKDHARSSSLRMHAVGLSVALSFLSACATVNEGPALLAPAPAYWANGPTGQEPFRQAETNAWWQSYGDPALNRLIDRALVQSPTIEQALARVDSARALARSEGAGLYPQVGGNGDVDLTRRIFWLARGPECWGGSIRVWAASSRRDFQGGFDATWEIDLFGRVRNAAASARLNAEALTEDAETARISLIAEIVRAYIELRSAERRRAIIGSDIAARQRLVQLVQSQNTAGVVADFDVQRAIAATETAKARLPTADLAMITARHRLATLVGEPTPDQTLRKKQVSHRPDPPAHAQLSLSTLVRTRPEIRSAERIVARRAADVGVATAELYPRLTLSGTLTIAGNLLARPLPGQLVTVAGGPAITIPLLDWGQRRAVVDAREADLREAVAAYRAAVLQGIEEVEVSLASIRNQNARIGRLQKAVAATFRHMRRRTLSTSRADGLTERLNAETEWRQAELELADAREAAVLRSFASIRRSVPPLGENGNRLDRQNTKRHQSQSYDGS